MTIVADDDSLGHATSPNPTFGYESTDARDRERRRHDAIVALFAGPAAEHVLCGEPFTFDEESGSQSDYDTAWQEMRMYHVRYSRSVGDDKYDAAFERLQQKALQLVRRHSSAIQRVAAALTARQTLAAAELRALIDTRPAFAR